MSESRTGQRFPLQLPIRVGPKSKGQKATTRDVSAAGVFIQADPSLKVGAHVRFNITLPAKLLGTPRDVDVECEGRVVRVENAARSGRGKSKKDLRRVGLACVIDKYTFVRRA
jgi:hypothetical protein